MSLSQLARGAAVGFSIAAPVGPIGLLCIRRTLAEGRAAGLVSGLGAATADAVYGAVAAFGLTAVSGALISRGLELRLVGGGFLCWLGWKTFRAPAASTAAAAAGGRGLLGDYASTFGLTLTNPATILSFVAVFAGLGLAASSSRADAASMVAGVFAGSAAWWLLLSGVVSLLRDRVGPRQLAWVNRLSGAVLFAFGALALAGCGGPPKPDARALHREHVQKTLAPLLAAYEKDPPTGCDYKRMHELGDQPVGVLDAEALRAALAGAPFADRLKLGAYLVPVAPSGSLTDAQARLVPEGLERMKSWRSVVVVSVVSARWPVATGPSEANVTGYAPGRVELTASMLEYPSGAPLCRVPFVAESSALLAVTDPAFKAAGGPGERLDQDLQRNASKALYAALASAWPTP